MQPNTDSKHSLINGRELLETHGRHVLAYYGHRGALSTWSKYKLVPYHESYFLMIDRETGAFKAFHGAIPYNLSVEELDWIKRKDWLHE